MLRRRAFPGGPLRVLAAVLGLALTGCGAEDGARSRPPVGVEVGNTAPPLAGTLPSGEAFRFRAADGPAVIVFYRGGYCGLCRVRLRQLEEHLAAYRERGVRVVAVTPEPPAAAAETARATGATFPLVSVGPAALRRWGLVGPPGEPLPPATFVLDDRGVIVFRHRGENAADRASDLVLLTLLDRAARR